MSPGGPGCYTHPVVLLSLAIALILSAPPGGPVPPSIPGVRMDTNGPPPALLADPRGPAPSPESVWVEGYWQWSGGRYAWVFGEWAIPPGKPPCAWVPARWTSDDRGWTFHEPHWRPVSGPPGRIHEPPPVPRATAPAPPPPLLVETQGTPPSRESVWIPGFWAWSGHRSAWVAGEWSAPYPGHSWVEGHWKRNGGAFSWVAGRWSRNRP